tara:strand:- start:186 stop:479 length:294 start_codon:yes stop_codon:yes gene_type:complete
MAIDKKIPSPQDIKKTPVKFTPQEIEEINVLRKSISDITYSFGQLSISKMNIKKQEDNLNIELTKLEKQEMDLAKKLSSKYGKGSLNLENGEFSPVP